VLGVLAITVCVLVVVVFFWFQRYIVHTPEGVRLDVPFLRGILAEIPEWPEEPDYPPEDDSAEVMGPGYQPPEEAEPTDFRSLWITGADLETVPDWEMALAGFHVDGILVAMSDATGQLQWHSQVPLAISYGLRSEETPDLSAMGDEVHRAALLFGFQNRLLAERNPPLALRDGWVDPDDPEVRRYVAELARELGQLGFDEIVLADWAYPPGGRGDAAVIIEFLRYLARALAAMGVELSILTQEADWWYDLQGETPIYRPEFGALMDVVSRFYCLLEPETAMDPDRIDGLQAVARSVLGRGYYRFVPVGAGSGPEEGNWVVLQ